MSDKLHTEVEKLKETLNEDLHCNYDGDYDSWVEIALDCPSDEVEKQFDVVCQMLSQSEFEQLMDDVIDPYINSLGEE